MYLRRFLFTLFAALIATASFGPALFGQSTAKMFTLKAANQCAQVSVSTYASVGIQVTGTFSATLQPEVSIGGQTPQNSQVTPTTSNLAQATITTTGTYAAAVGGMDTFLLCVSSYVSGSAVVWLNPSDKVNASTLGGGAVTSVSGTANQIDVATGTTTPVISLDPAVQISSGASLVPTVFGQVTSSGLLANSSGLGGVAAPASPTLTGALTGGTLVSGGTVYVMITANTAGGETKASPEVVIGLNGGNNCGSGSSCTVTVNLPASCTSPVAPQTGCTVYSANATLAEKRQNASAACVNVTANCVIGALGLGVGVPTSNTASVLPSPLATTLAHPSETPFLYGYSLTNSNWEDFFSVEQDQSTALRSGNTTNLDPIALTMTRPMHMDNTGPTVGFNPDVNNCLFCVSEAVGVNVASGAGIQDNAVGITQTDNLQSSAAYPIDQELGLYIEKHVGAPGRTQNNFGCSPATTETCAGAARFVFQTNNTTGSYGGGLGEGGVSGVTFNNNSGSASLSVPAFGVAGVYQNDTAYNLGGTTGIGVYGLCNDATGGSSNGKCIALYAKSPLTRFPGSGISLTNVGVEIDPQASGAHFGEDYGLFEFVTNANDSLNFFGGPAVFGQGIQGAILPTQIQTPTGGISFTVQCTSGGTTWTYRVVLKDAAGGWAPAAAGSLSSTTTGCATLTGAGAQNIITFTGPAYLGYPGETNFGVYSMDVYRTAAGGTPNTTGLIAANVSCFLPSGQCSVTDNGLAVIVATSSDAAVPTYATSGATTGYTYRTISNCAVNSASPAACGSAPSGAVVIPTTTTTYTINTTAVTYNSRIQLTWLTFAANLPSSPTCVAPSILSLPTISAIVPGVSFTIALSSTTGQTCPMYDIKN